MPRAIIRHRGGENPSWPNAARCDEWEITTLYQGKSFFRRRPQYKVTARGWRGGKAEAFYGLLSDCGTYGTAEDAEKAMREIIRKDIEAHNAWLKRLNQRTKKFTTEEI